MGRKSKKAEIARAVRAYLGEVETQPPDEQHAIDVKHVAAVIGVSRTSLYQYGLAEEIKAAARRQREQSHLSDCHQSDQVRRLRQELKLAEERNKALLAQINVIEANAARLGIDPEELYKSLAKPVRSTSHAGRRYERKRKY